MVVVDFGTPFVPQKYEWTAPSEAAGESPHGSLLFKTFKTITLKEMDSYPTASGSLPVGARL